MVTLCLVATAKSEERKTSSLPKPSQVDKPGMIRFIKPDPKGLPGIVVDDVDAKLIGQWKHSVHTPPFVGQSYLHDMKEAKGKKSATFVPDLPKGGRYEVRMSHNSNVRRAKWGSGHHSACRWGKHNHGQRGRTCSHRKALS